MDTIEPYMFEPEFSEEQIQERRRQRDQTVQNMSVVNASDRTSSLDWCSCEKCKLMSHPRENICCSENDCIMNLKGDVSCVTDCPIFLNHILSKDGLYITRQMILQTTINSYKKRMLKKELDNKAWRFLAYRQFVFWINHWANLGKGNRVVIPSCVVTKIRDSFPEESGFYVGFIPSGNANENEWPG